MAEEGTPEHVAVSSLTEAANTEDGKHDSGGDVKLSDEKDVGHDEKTTSPDQDNKSNDDEVNQPKADPQDTASNKETDVKTMAPLADGSSPPVSCSQTDLPSSLNKAGDRSHGDERSKENGKKSLEIENLTAENLSSSDRYSDDNKIAASHTDGSTTSVSGRGANQANNQRHDEKEDKEDSDLPGDKGSEASNDRVSEAEEDGKHKEDIETPNKTLTSPAQTVIKDEEEPKAYSPQSVSFPETDDDDKKVTTEDISGAFADRIPEAEEGRKKLPWLAMAIGVIILAILVPLLRTQSLTQKHSLNQVDFFNNQMERVKAEFTHQRTELWTRSRIHLLRHLQSAQPTEPVSIILTAGLGAQQTLRCLAHSLAIAFSSARNASFLFIDGHSKAGQESDLVKLDIDRQLQGAFEGNTQAAVIHRFEELPPGSTLIFYRYCDHENAAYKKPLLVFTVLLGDQREIPADAQFSAVEEMVDDHLQKRFLSHSRPVSFDSMDRDKYGGLWSRISHLILPVAAEETVERKGCMRTEIEP
uniref:Torsin-1A-interacting protein 2-like n=1 Tax=Gouania willdenowi TaxID=441366 RepID=A0A8C5D464_GOUWI